MEFTTQDKWDIFETAISWIVVFGMFVYGGAKVVQFGDTAQIDTPVSELTGMELMWAFYGYSKAFAITLGILEITGGILILIKKTRLIGCIFTSTILVNIILQDIFYAVHLGALKAAVLYQSILLLILWLHKDQLIQAVRTLLQATHWDNPKKKILFKLFLAFVLFVVFRITEYYLTIVW